MRRPPRLFDWLTSLLLFGGLAVSAAPRAEEAPSPKVVRDLYYGEVLFQFYRQDDFAALTHLLAARDAKRVSHHDADSELLLGGLYLSYGQHRQAAGIFERLLAADPEPAVRDRAWFYLGKIRYQRGLHDEALASFARVGPDLPAALAAELPMLVAQTHMAKGDFDAALAQADYVVQGYYRTAAQEHCPIETQVSVCQTDGMGRTHIWTVTQAVYFNQGALATILQKPQSKVHMIGGVVGGGFGAKNDPHASAGHPVI